MATHHKINSRGLSFSATAIATYRSSLRRPRVRRQRLSSLKNSRKPSTLTTSRKTYRIKGLWAGEYRPVSSSSAVSSMRSKLDSKIWNIDKYNGRVCWVKSRIPSSHVYADGQGATLLLNQLCVQLQTIYMRNDRRMRAIHCVQCNASYAAKPGMPPIEKPRTN